MGEAIPFPAGGCGGRRGPVLPVEFMAFCALYRGRYLRYARARLGDEGCGEVVVEQALEELARVWGQALRSRCTRVFAWELLRGRVREARARGVRETPVCAVVYGRLPVRGADGVVLHHLLRMPVAEVAEVMGLGPAEVLGELRLAGRCLPGLPPVGA
ncbi:hypothetical protein ACWGJ2_36635 [Streptomyces sp. NPDC054796]